MSHSGGPPIVSQTARKHKLRRRGCQIEKGIQSSLRRCAELGNSIRATVYHLTPSHNQGQCSPTTFALSLPHSHSHHQSLAYPHPLNPLSYASSPEDYLIALNETAPGTESQMTDTSLLGAYTKAMLDPADGLDGDYRESPRKKPRITLPRGHACVSCRQVCFISMQCR